MATHWNVICDGCELLNMVHYRYKCLRCVDYDLCRACFDNKVEGGSHSKSHPFQCLLDRAARELHFDGDDVPDLSADSFTCPFCGIMGYAPKELVRHVQMKHRGDTTLVICPLCVASSSSGAQRMSNLVNHVSLMHGTGILRIGGGGGGSSGVGPSNGNAPVAHAGGFRLRPVPQHQSHSRAHSHLHSYAHSHANSLAHSHFHFHSHSHGHGHGGHGQGRGFGPVYYTGSSGSQWPIDLSSSASQDDDTFAESWLADRSSLSGSMHTMRDADFDLGNRTPHPQVTGAPLASEDTCSELDSDDTSESRI